MMKFRDSKNSNITVCYDYKLEPTWIIMELCDCNAQQYFIKKNWILKPSEKRDILTQVN